MEPGGGDAPPRGSSYGGFRLNPYKRTSGAYIGEGRYYMGAVGGAPASFGRGLWSTPPVFEVVRTVPFRSVVAEERRGTLRGAMRERRGADEEPMRGGFYSAFPPTLRIIRRRRGA